MIRELKRDQPLPAHYIPHTLRRQQPLPGPALDRREWRGMLEGAFGAVELHCDVAPVYGYVALFAPPGAAR